jgi:hypothetical protein
MKNILLTVLFAGLLAGNAAAASIYELKKDFVNLRFAMFLHFNMATFENKNGTSDYGSGNANTGLFNPIGLNCSQWATAAKSAKKRLWTCRVFRPVTGPASSLYQDNVGQCVIAILVVQALSAARILVT